LYLKDINERKENTIKNRALALIGLETQASVMLRSSNQKFPPAQVGDTVRVRVPDIDRGRMDYQNILAVVMDVDNDFYKLGTQYGIISQLYTRNQFAVCKEKLISLNDVLSDKTMSLRQVSTAASKSGGQGYVRCNCKKKCNTKKCNCKNGGILCNSKCHDSLPCCNK